MVGVEGEFVDGELFSRSSGKQRVEDPRANISLFKNKSPIIPLGAVGNEATSYYIGRSSFTTAVNASGSLPV